MAYRRRTYKKFFRKKRNFGGFKKYVKRSIKKLRKRTRREIKYNDNIVGSTAIYAAGAPHNLVYSLAGIAQGVHPYERVGDEIWAKDMCINYKLETASNETSNMMVMMAIVMDKSFNGNFMASSPLVSDVFNGSANDPLAFITPSNKNRFRVLRRKIVAFGQGSAGVSPTVRQGKIVCNIGRKISYVSAGSNVASLGENALWFMVTCIAPAVTSPSITWDGRLHFYDNE